MLKRKFIIIEKKEKLVIVINGIIKEIRENKNNIEVLYEEDELTQVYVIENGTYKKLQTITEGVRIGGTRVQAFATKADIKFFKIEKDSEGLYKIKRLKKSLNPINDKLKYYLIEWVNGTPKLNKNTVTFYLK